MARLVVLQSDLALIHVSCPTCSVDRRVSRSDDAQLIGISSYPPSPSKGEPSVCSQTCRMPTFTHSHSIRAGGRAHPTARAVSCSDVLIGDPMASPHLFSPIRIGSLELKNRVVMAPLDVGLHGPEGLVTDRYIDFLVERTEGEIGLIISEFTSVRLEKRAVTTSVWDDKFIPRLTRMAAAVKEAGARILL